MAPIQKLLIIYAFGSVKIIHFIEKKTQNIQTVSSSIAAVELA